MKVEISKSKKVDFKAFKLIVSIETIEDLKELHNRLNLNHNIINEELNNNWCKPLYTDSGIYKAFDMLDDELDEFNHFNPKN